MLQAFPSSQSPEYLQIMWQLEFLRTQNLMTPIFHERRHATFATVEAFPE